ncbi:MAG: hypothetical protein V1664_02730 [Candidatus Uhrbacteria bacterium]
MLFVLDFAEMIKRLVAGELKLEQLEGDTLFFLSDEMIRPEFTNDWFKKFLAMFEDQEQARSLASNAMDKVFDACYEKVRRVFFQLLLVERD